MTDETKPRIRFEDTDQDEDPERTRRRNASEDQARLRYQEEFGKLHERVGIVPSPAFNQAQAEGRLELDGATAPSQTVQAAPAKTEAKPQVLKPVTIIPSTVKLDEVDPVARVNPYMAKIAMKDVGSLPSKGLSYPEGAQIMYRTYTLGETEEFESSQFNTRERYLYILRGVDTNFPKEHLTLSDVMYLGLLRRLATMGTTKVIVQTKCPRCENTNPVIQDTGELEFDDIPVPALPITIKFTFGSHIFSPITIGDYLRMLDSNLTHSLAVGVAVQCRSLPLEEALPQFENMADPGDVRKVRKLDGFMYHGVKDLQVACRHNLPVTEEQEGGPLPCGQIYSVSLENSAEAFIYPFRGEGDNDDDEITFG